MLAPVISAANPFDGATVDAETDRQRAMGFGAGSNFRNGALGEFSLPVRFTAREMFRATVAPPTFGIHVRDVVLDRSEEQMSGVTAELEVATVANTGSVMAGSGRYRTMRQGPRKAMRRRILAVPLGLSVSDGCDGSGPRPAFTGTALVNLRPEQSASLGWSVELGHTQNVARCLAREDR